MALLDHFRPPLSEWRRWTGFLSTWATAVSAQLNAALPDGYFAEPNVRFRIEMDVAEMSNESSGGWVPPPPDQTVPVTLSGPVVEIGIFSQSGGPTLAGAIELVSPANKDRPETRDAFVSKCATYLQAGVGLVIVDVVTERTADLHQELLTRLGVTAAGPAVPLYGTAYRPLKREGDPTLDVWFQPLTLGRPLPTLPLWLRGDVCVPVELQATYERTCTEQRLPAA